MPKPFYQRVFKVNLALSTLCRHENSVQSCFFNVCILRPLRPFKLKQPMVIENVMEMNEVH